MQMKKEVLRARLQKQLDKIEQIKAEHESKFIPYRDELLIQDKIWVEKVKKATTWKEYNHIQNNNPEKPYPPYYEEKETRLKRNLAILEAIEGDVIEVDKLKTGRNFTIESIFEDTL